MTILRIGFGVSGPLGQKWFSERKTHALIEAALVAGVRRFDTAPFYFDAEERLGAALAAWEGDEVFISTKTGTRREGRRLTKDFSEKAIRADVDRSLRRLGRDRIDLLYLHGPTSDQIDAATPVIAALKREGRILRAGVCGEGAPLAHAVDSGFDAIMGVYNVLDLRHEAIFSAAKTKGLTTVAIAPLAQGVFDPRFRIPATLSDYWRLLRAAFRGRYGDDAIRMARRAMGAADPVEAALGFVLANPFIDVVMTTTTKAGHLAHSLAAAAKSIDPDLYADLKRLSLDRTSRGA